MKLLPLALAAAAASVPACNRVGGESVAESPLLEMRDARGESRLTVWKTGEGLRWVDAQEGAGSATAEAGGSLRARDPIRGPIEATFGVAAGVRLSRSDGTALRLSREGGVLRLGDGAGIPIVRVRAEKEEVLVHDAGGLVVLRVRRAGGRIVVLDRQGGTVAFVLGETALESAALAAIPALSAGERTLLLMLAQRL